MPLYLPRRYRGKLLFPPGLLALAGLLWLGCVALGTHPEQLKQPHIMQLNMMPLDLSRPMYRWHENYWPTSLSSPSKIAAFRPWCDVQFIGNQNIDKLARIQLIASIRVINSDALHDGGVRVNFGTMAKYEDLVFTLDLMLRENIKKYWLDIEHEPAVLYAITVKREIEPATWVCGTQSNYSIHEPSETNCDNWLVDFDEAVVRFWQFKWLKPLTQVEWRISICFFAIIALLSCWQIIRNWLAGRG